MALKDTFKTLIALHQQEMPYNLIPREQELPINSNEIIVVSGIRRCGKSSQLKLTINKLLQQGVAKERILYIGFDDERFQTMSIDDFDYILQAYREMYPEQNLSDIYMFFDEIQLINGWELFILRVFKNYCRNIYVTGSTAKMISEEITSALRGWPNEIKAYPLNFNEYLTFKGIAQTPYTEQQIAILQNALKNYCLEGGFPQVDLINQRSEQIRILQSYFNTMLFHDMIEHYNITSSSAVVKYFLKRVINNLTKPTSVLNIYNDIKSQGLKVSKDTLYDWLLYASNIFILKKVPKYSHSLIKESSSPAKYYTADIGIKNAIMFSQSEDYGKALENIVYLALERTLNMDDKIYYFLDKEECDFVVQRGFEIDQLVQVCWSLDANNLSREAGGMYAASQATGCKNCTIVTYDTSDTIEHNGLSIKVVPAWKYLLETK